MVFIARFPGRCDDCREAIEVGEVVEYKGLERVLVHEVCPDVGEAAELDRDAKREVCPECFLLKPCVCGVF